MGQLIPIKDHDKPCPAHRPAVPEAYYTKQEIDSKMATKTSSDTFSHHDTNEYRHVPTDGEVEGKILTVNAEGKPEWSEQAWGYAKWGMISGDIEDQEDLQQEFTNEATARQQADTTLQTNIDTEATTRAAADTAEATARQQADVTLQTNIDNETTRAEGAETQLQSNIDDETIGRQEGDKTEKLRALEAEELLQSNINEEKTRASDAEAHLQTNINTEATTRSEADTALGTRITNETTRATNAETNLNTIKENISNKVQIVDQTGTADQYPSARAVYAAIQAIPTGMIYQGTLAHTETIEATVHELPTAEEAHEGWTYKVIEQYEYITGETAEKGDLYVCGWNTETEIHQWKIIPAFEKVKDVQVDGVSVVDSAGFANITYKFFWCTYGTTTYQQITDALAEGKVPVCIYQATSDDSNAYTNQFFVYAGSLSGIHYLSATYNTETFSIRVNSNNEWTQGSTGLEVTNNKKQTIVGNESSTAYYPSTKAVADYWTLQNKFYWCNYGTTTAAEIEAALADGKVPVLKYPESSNDSNLYRYQFFYYTGSRTLGEVTTHYFGSNGTYGNELSLIQVYQGTWSKSFKLLESEANKKNKIVGNESSTTYYPNTKAVADYWELQNKFYWCTYSATGEGTTFDEVTQALANGKTPVVVYPANGNESDAWSHQTFWYCKNSTTQYWFSCSSQDSNYCVYLNNDNTWHSASYSLQETYCKTDDVETYKTSSTYYPSTKAVADYWTLQNKFFFCTYDTTTYDEITTAIENGKTPVVVYTGSVLDEDGNEVDTFTNALFTYIDNGGGTTHRFGAIYYTTSASIYIKQTDNQWNCTTFDVELSRYKLSTIVGNESSTTYYPNTKAVADYWTDQNKWFWCTFSTTGEGTTYDEITQAIANGKTPICVYTGNAEDKFNNGVFFYNYTDSSHHYFGTVATAGDIWVGGVNVSTSNIWTKSEQTAENVYYKKSTIVGQESSTINYPNCKAVADYWELQNKFYWCTYSEAGTGTTYQEITDAITAGKTPVCIYTGTFVDEDGNETDRWTNCLFTYGFSSNGYHCFGASMFSGDGLTAVLQVKDTDNVWSKAQGSLQNVNYRVNTIEGYESDTARYPSTKAIADYNKFYWCTYGTTTYAEITTAIENGKVPICIYTGNGEDEEDFFHNMILTYAYPGTNTHTFSSSFTSGTAIVYVTSTDTWVKSTNSFEINYKFSNCVNVTTSSIPVTEYNLAAFTKDNLLIPMAQGGGVTTKPVTTIPFKPENIFLTQHSIAANTNVTGDYLLNAVYTGNAGYAFNEELPAYRDIYLVGTYDRTTGLFTLDSSSLTSYYLFVPTNESSITLSDYFTAGKYYIHVGRSSNAANVYQFEINNPMYYFDGTSLIDPHDNKFYWVTYGTTTYAEITNALAAGKVPLCVYHANGDEEEPNYFEGMFLTFSRQVGSNYYFGSCYDDGNYYVAVTSGNTWSRVGKTFETYYTHRYYESIGTSELPVHTYDLIAKNEKGLLVSLIRGGCTTSYTKMAGNLPFKPYDILFWNGGTVEANSSIVSTGFISSKNVPSTLYQFNTALQAYHDVYLVGTYDKTTDLFTLDTTDTAGETCYYVFVPNNDSTINLSDYFTTGKYYIKLGASEPSYAMQLETNNPMYYFNGTSLIDGKQDFLVMTQTEYEALSTKSGYYFTY